jgi:hypothetical protein
VAKPEERCEAQFYLGEWVFAAQGLCENRERFAHRSG